MIRLFEKSPEWHARRVDKITGSKVGAIMRGGEEAYKLWLIETGQAEGEDLTWKIPVLMGSALECVTLGLYEHDTGRELSRINEWSESPKYPWMACEIDAFDAEKDAVLDAKFTLGFGSEEDHWQRYVPQLTHNAVVTGASHIALAVLTGKGEFKWFLDAVDPFYAAELIEREETFAEMVRMRAWLGDFTPANTPPPPEQWREVDMSTSNEWCSHAVDWLEHRAGAKKFEGATKALKMLMPADCGKGYGHGVVITRARNGNLTAKEHTA